MSRSLLLVTGAGRSGTSTVAGTLHHLGIHVPGPYLKANESNPRGFYECKWSVDFHNRLLKRANVTIADGRPEAADLMRAAFRDDDADALAAWVDEATADHPWTALKDPRTTWTLDRWAAATASLDVDLAFLVMLRHPAEVLGSRATHYAAGIETLGETGFAVKNLAGWVNALLLTERQTRGRRRSFVKYDDLLADWRTTMQAASTDLGLGLDVPPATTPHEVDEFIDPQLSRHRLTWDDVDVLPELAEVAEEIWQGYERLAGSHGSDRVAQAALDDAGVRYAAMYRAAEQLAQDSTAAAVTQARREAKRAAKRGLVETKPAPGVADRLMSKAKRLRGS